ncbi:MAG: ThaI family type II restriction endonuclease [Spirochaetaceae bacterium]|nr:ThaI family type II restriction endonuclease [Spirochaetaceae bacterium]
MNNQITKLFTDELLINKMRSKLPYLFQLAELESSRAGKVGMEVGSVRERIIVSLLVYKFGEENVRYELSITEAETDVVLFGNPISIKTISGKKTTGVKAIWTVDAQKAIEFCRNYSPSCDMILVHINWGGEGGFYYVYKGIQLELLKAIGYQNYLKLPKVGTNPRGVEIAGEVMDKLITHKQTEKIMLNWQKADINFKPLERWLELWQNP